MTELRDDWQADLSFAAILARVSTLCRYRSQNCNFMAERPQRILLTIVLLLAGGPLHVAINKSG